MIVYFPVPDRVIETVNKWGRKFQKDTRIHKIDFLNRHHNKYAWDNLDLDDNDNALVEANVPHPHLAAEMPGVELASETPGVYQGILREDGEIEIIKPSQDQQVQPTIHNSSLSVVGPDRTPGVPLVNFSNDGDNFASSQKYGVIPKREPNFEVTTDSYLDSASDDESVEEDDTFNEETFAEELITLIPVQTGSTINANGLHQSTRTPSPPQVTKVSFQIKQYDLDGWNKVV